MTEIFFFLFGVLLRALLLLAIIVIVYKVEEDVDNKRKNKILSNMDNIKIDVEELNKVQDKKIVMSMYNKDGEETIKETKILDWSDDASKLKVEATSINAYNMFPLESISGSKTSIWIDNAGLKIIKVYDDVVDEINKV